MDVLFPTRQEDKVTDSNNREFGFHGMEPDDRAIACDMRAMESYIPPQANPDSDELDGTLPWEDVLG